jgi:hypothetical protein
VIVTLFFIFLDLNHPESANVILADDAYHWITRPVCFILFIGAFAEPGIAADERTKCNYRFS